MKSNDLYRKRPTYNPDERKTGVALEKFMFDYLNAAIGTSRLPFVREFCKLYRGKRYWSKSRKADIPCDISVEVFVGNKEEYSLLWIWECKDWSRNVGVGILEEFHGKLQQLGPDRTKGTLVICNGLTEPAYNYARDHGIGVWKVQVTSNYIEGDVKNYLPCLKPGEMISGRFDGSNKLFYAGNEVAFIPPDQVNVSHIDEGLPEFISTCLKCWLGSQFDENEEREGMSGIVLRFKIVE